MSTVIITNCTNRKRQGTSRPLELAGSDYKSLSAMSAVWFQQLKNHESSIPAATLYAGRSVQDAKRAAEKLRANLMFASTGIGLVGSDQLCPVYNLTVAQEPNSIRPQLTKLGVGPADWWDEINAKHHRPNPISELAQRAETSQVFVALSSNYIDLVSNDLAQIPAADLAKVRIFTSRPGLKRLPPHLQHLVMPYDERLESSHLAGTRADFPQRALRHYVEVVMRPGVSLTTEWEAVASAMNQLQHARVVKRRRVPDAEITSLLIKAWGVHKGSSARLLRFLRDDALVSCEQSRFRDLWLAVKEKKLWSEV